MATKMKYRVQKVQAENKGMYRLTLSPEAFAMAILNSGTISGYVAYSRLDGQWDVMVAPDTAAELNKQRKDGEHLTNVVERILKG